MKVLALVILGVIGALGLLRGLEILVLTHAMGGAIFPLALGLLFIALFLRRSLPLTPPSPGETIVQGNCTQPARSSDRLMN